MFYGWESEGSERISDLSFTASNEQARIQQSNLLLLRLTVFLVCSSYHRHLHSNTLISTRPLLSSVPIDQTVTLSV